MELGWTYALQQTISAILLSYVIFRADKYVCASEVSWLHAYNYLNSGLISPLTRATITGTPIHAGTRYNKAGWNHRRMLQYD